MLPREKGGVVDASLKVYGTKNVRVADLSTLPLMTAAHTQCKFRLRPMVCKMLTLELSYHVRHCRARYVALSLSRLVCLRVSQNPPIQRPTSSRRTMVSDTKIRVSHCKTALA